MARSKAGAGIKPARRTPARSNCIGTRTFTLVGPSWPPSSSESTTTRKYLGRGFPAPDDAGSDNVVNAGGASMAAMRRSASSALILPSDNICRIWRRCSFIGQLLENVKRHSGGTVFHFNVRIGERIQYLPHHCDPAEWVHLADQAREEDKWRKQNDQREQQDPDQKKRHPQPEGVALLVA